MMAATAFVTTPHRPEEKEHTGAELQAVNEAFNEDEEEGFPPLTREEEAAFLSWAQAHQQGFVPGQGVLAGAAGKRAPPSTHAHSYSHLTHPNAGRGHARGSSQPSTRSTKSSQRSQPAWNDSMQPDRPTRSSDPGLREVPAAGSHARIAAHTQSYALPPQMTSNEHSAFVIKDRKWLSEQHDIAAANAMLLGRLVAIGQGDRAFYDDSHGLIGEGASDLRAQRSWNDQFTSTMVRSRQEIVRYTSAYNRQRHNAVIDRENLRIQARLKNAKRSEIHDPAELQKSFERHQAFRELRSHFKTHVGSPAASGATSPERSNQAQHSTRYKNHQKRQLYESASAPNLAGGTLKSPPQDAAARTKQLLQQTHGGSGQGTPDESKEQPSDAVADEAATTSAPPKSPPKSPSRRISPVRRTYSPGRRRKPTKRILAAQGLHTALSPASIQQLMEHVFFEPQLFGRTTAPASTAAPAPAAVNASPEKPKATAANASPEKSKRLTPLKAQPRARPQPVVTKGNKALSKSASQPAVGAGRRSNGARLPALTHTLHHGLSRTSSADGMFFPSHGHPAGSVEGEDVEDDAHSPAPPTVTFETLEKFMSSASKVPLLLELTEDASRKSPQAKKSKLKEPKVEVAAKLLELELEQEQQAEADEQEPAADEPDEAQPDADQVQEQALEAEAASADDDQAAPQPEEEEPAEEQ